MLKRLPFIRKDYASIRSDMPTELLQALLVGADEAGEELRDLLADILQESRPTAAEIEKRMQSRRPAEEVPVEFAPGAGPAV